MLAFMSFRVFLIRQSSFNDCIRRHIAQFEIPRQIIVVSLKGFQMNQNQTLPRSDTPEGDKTKVAPPAQQPQLQPSKAEPEATPQK
ncbi:hypothetical protein [Rhodospirillaceae bacterium SYSU D60014]|uniref:hypothetical protein n=1 Tax=Virgifigura deserti TaxID=2268457 RepID=UPI0013C4408D